MSKLLIVEDVKIVVVTKRQSFSIISEQSLTDKGILPAGAEIKDRLQSPDTILQLKLESGLFLSIEPPRMVFSEPIGEKPYDELAVYEVAKKCLKSYKQFTYTALGINPRTYAVFKDADEAKDFLKGRLIAQGPWNVAARSLDHVKLTMTYPFEDGALTITIEPGSKPLSEGSALPVVWFNANYHHDIETSESDRGLMKAVRIITGSRKTIKDFVKLLKSSFLEIDS